VTVAEVMEIVLRDATFYRKSGGGITLSGGEPMMQPEFVTGLLATARESGLHTALDTSGFAPWEAFERILGLVDLFLFDVKDTDEKRHREYTGVELAPILDNLRRLDAAGAKTLLRCIIVPGVNDDKRHAERLGEIRRTLKGATGLETLEYHSLGLPKWRALGMAALARDFSRKS
jgi:pyruvate formate lyase activating enzyme